MEVSDYSKDVQQRAGKFFQKERSEVTDLEKRVLNGIVENRQISRNPIKILEDDRTFGEWHADKVAAFGGSRIFVLGFGGVFLRHR